MTYKELLVQNAIGTTNEYVVQIQIPLRAVSTLSIKVNAISEEHAVEQAQHLCAIQSHDDILTQAVGVISAPTRPPIMEFDDERQWEFGAAEWFPSKSVSEQCGSLTGRITLSANPCEEVPRLYKPTGDK